MAKTVVMDQTEQPVEMVLTEYQDRQVSHLTN